MDDVATGPGWELRLGRWQDVLRDVDNVGSVITDPPYSARTHKGHNSAQYEEDGSREHIGYGSIDKGDIEDIVFGLCPTHWYCCLTDSILAPVFREMYDNRNLTSFAPVPCVTPGMTVRAAGEGPSSWTVYLMVARTSAASKWGTLDGAYTDLPRGERIFPGSKSLVLMRKIVRDYSRPGDLVCDPYAGSGTTLLAAVIEGRRAIGAEMDKGRFDMAVRRLREGHTPNMFGE